MDNKSVYFSVKLLEFSSDYVFQPELWSKPQYLKEYDSNNIHSPFKKIGKSETAI